MKTYKENPWPKRKLRIEEQPKPPEGATVTTVYVPEPKFKRRKQFKREAELCEHINTKDFYKRIIIQKKRKGPKYKLTDNDVIEARSLIKEMTFDKLAEKYNVSQECIYNAVKGLTFKHLNAKHRPQN